MRRRLLTFLLLALAAYASEGCKPTESSDTCRQGLSRFSDACNSTAADSTQSAVTNNTPSAAPSPEPVANTALNAAKISKIELTHNGVPVSSLTNVQIGDVIGFNVIATDPNSRPLAYDLSIKKSCAASLESVSSWSTSSTNYTWTIESESQGLTSTCVYFRARVRNDDGVEYQGPGKGDDSEYVYISVASLHQPAQIGGIALYRNGVLTGNSNGFHEGDEARIEVTANDPQGLPIEYRISLKNSCSGLVTVLSNWSTTTTSATHIFGPESVGLQSTCVYFRVQVRNSDPIEHLGPGDGDSRHYIYFQIQGPLNPPSINRIDATVNSSPRSPIGTLTVGDALSITAVASDPNQLPLEYKIYFKESCSASPVVVSNWSSTYQASVVLTGASAGLQNTCVYFRVLVRNNDGQEYLGSGSGDASSYLYLPVNF